MNCERCNVEHDGEYGSGRFCSRKCANSYSSMLKREEVNKKVSRTLLAKNAEKRKLDGTVLKKDRPKIKKERVLTSQMAQYPYDKYRLYIVFHKKEGRRVACLYKSESDRLSMAYAKYLMSVELKRILGRDEEVDHIDNNKSNDDISNLQILSKRDNSKKHTDLKPAEKIELICPICHITFIRNKRYIRYWSKYRSSFCCSHKCGYEQMKLTNKNNKK